MKVHSVLTLGICSILTLSACTNVPTIGDELRARGSSYTTAADNWERGQAQIAEGNRLIKQGKKEISSGESKVKKGKSLIKSGEKLTEKSEAAYQSGP